MNMIQRLLDGGRMQKERYDRAAEAEARKMQSELARKVYDDALTQGEVEEALNVPHGTVWVRAVVQIMRAHFEGYAEMAMQKPGDDAAKMHVAGMRAMKAVEQELLAAIENAQHKAWENARKSVAGGQ